MKGKVNGATGAAKVKADGKPGATAAPPVKDLAPEKNGTAPVVVPPVKDKPAKGAPRKAKAKQRRKRAYVRREPAVVEPEEGSVPVKSKLGARLTEAASAASSKQQVAGFSVTIAMLHMGLSLRVPEMALEKGEAQLLGGALDELCREFGYTPSTKGAAVLAFAGTVMMVYGPKVSAVRARKRDNHPLRRAAYVDPPPPPVTAITPAPQPQVPDADFQALMEAAERAKMAPRGTGVLN